MTGSIRKLLLSSCFFIVLITGASSDQTGVPPKCLAALVYGLFSKKSYCTTHNASSFQPAIQSLIDCGALGLDALRVMQHPPTHQPAHSLTRAADDSASFCSCSQF